MKPAPGYVDLDAAEEAERAERFRIIDGPEVRATPFSWPVPSKIPRRRWLYGRHLIRGFASATIAPGGVGKSSLLIADAFAMATGRSLLGIAPEGRLRVWLFNGEDPLDELERRMTAVALRYQITEADCGDRLFVDSGRNMQMVIVKQPREGLKVIEPMVEAIMAAITVRKIDVLIIDPFVSCHEVQENDNGAIDKVAKTWARIAHETGCAVELVHHSRKTGGEEVTIEHARGAVALIAAVRSARVLNVMTKDEAERAGIDSRHQLYFNASNGKANLAPPPDGKFWYQLESVDLGNGETITANGETVHLEGDSIGVVTPWRWPDPLEEISVEELVKAQKAVALERCRENVQSPAWAGHIIGKALGIDTSSPAGKSKVKGMLAIWIRNGMFKAVQRMDEKRNERTFIEVAEWAAL